MNSYLKVQLNKNSFFILLSILPKSLYTISFIVVLGVRKVRHVMEDEKLRRLVDKDIYTLDVSEDELKTLLISLDYFRDNAEGLDRARHYDIASRLRRSIIDALTLSAAIRSNSKIEETAIYMADSLEDLVRKQRG